MRTTASDRRRAVHIAELLNMQPQVRSHTSSNWLPTPLLQTWPTPALTSVELEVVLDLGGGQVELDRVADLDLGVRVADRAAVVGQQVRDAFGTHAQLLHAAQLVLDRREGKAIRRSQEAAGMNHVLD